MINAIINGIFKLIIGLINIILTPIDLVINQFLPGLSDGLAKVSEYFQWVCSLIPWGISWFGLETAVITLFVGYVTFELTVPFMIHAVKLAIKWYNSLKV